MSPIDITENTFETENNISFDPAKLNIYCPEKELMSKALVKMLKKIADLFNANLIKNADGLSSRKSVDFEVEWIRTSKQRLPQNKYKMSY